MSMSYILEYLLKVKKVWMVNKSSYVAQNLEKDWQL